MDINELKSLNIVLKSDYTYCDEIYDLITKIELNLSNDLGNFAYEYKLCDINFNYIRGLNRYARQDITELIDILIKLSSCYPDEVNSFINTDAFNRLNKLIKLGITQL